jgi:hypothetical protein
MPLRRAGLSNYYFIWRRQVQLRNRPQFLLQFKSDPGAMYDLRRALSEYYPGVSLPLLTDDQVIAGITKLVSAGELFIAKEEPVHGGSATQPDAAGPSSPPPSSPAPGPSSKSQAPESATFASNTNAAAQAAALSAAAASGAAVCPT